MFEHRSGAEDLALLHKWSLDQLRIIIELWLPRPTLISLPCAPSKDLQELVEGSELCVTIQSLDVWLL